jgi:gas vesicle protein
MANEDNRPVVIVERSSGLASFFWGALCGAGIALLMAPRTGEETREVLRSKGRRLRARAQGTAEDLHDRVGDGYERAKARVEEGIETARNGLTDIRTGTHDAVEAGKATVHSAREELERRLSEARAARKGRPSEAENDDVDSEAADLDELGDEAETKSVDDGTE